LDASQLATIAGTAFWGFPLAVIVGGMLVDVIGMKKLMMLAFVLHLAGIALTIFATGFWTLFISTLFIGMANGTVEAACNPMIATIYPENKTTKLNHFHLWFPGGIVIGTLIVYFFDKAGLSWQVQMATMFIPALIYGYLFARQTFPVTERVASGVSAKEMYSSLINPLFIFLIICMFGTAITELFTGQWMDVLLKNVAGNAILLITVYTAVQALGRGFAGPVVHRLAPQGVLLFSAVFAALGLYLLGHTTGNMIFVGAVVFGIGVCYFWPTMLGFVSENLPKTGAVGIGLMGAAGMLATYIYMQFMGGYYDNLVLKKLPAGATLDAYRSAAPNTTMAEAYAQAKNAAGPEVINTTLIIPIILIIAFIGLNIYMRSRKK
jgi:MFS family permease